MITSGLEVLDQFDEHWQPINSLCHPCAIRYHYTVRFENLLYDSERVLRIVQLSSSQGVATRSAVELTKHKPNALSVNSKIKGKKNSKIAGNNKSKIHSNLSNRPSVVSFPRVTLSKTPKLLPRYFGSLNSTTIRKLMNVYKDDIAMYWYH